MTHDRGMRLQNALARLLVANGWVKAESAGSGRRGSDILGTPGIVWENKTAREFKPTEFVNQARRHDPTGRDVPAVVYWPVGIGEQHPELTIAMLPTTVLLRLLREAGYGG